MTIARHARQVSPRLGPAGSGTTSWLQQRISAVALLPLGAWLIVSLFLHGGETHGEIVRWISSPLPGLLLVLCLAALWSHAVSGIEVIVEDYVHAYRSRVALHILVRLGGFALCTTGILSVLRVMFTRFW